MNVIKIKNGGEAIELPTPRGKGAVLFADSIICVREGDTYLDRAAVGELVAHLQAWLDTGSLEVR